MIRISAPRRSAADHGSIEGSIRRHALTPAQRQALADSLRTRRQELQAQLNERLAGLSAAEQALEEREQDGDDARQLASEREVEAGFVGLEERELQAIEAALARVDDPDYGRCVDCGRVIPFGRLQVEPQALRCVACASEREKLAG